MCVFECFGVGILLFKIRHGLGLVWEARVSGLSSMGSDREC
jgi:hypothetical protein